MPKPKPNEIQASISRQGHEMRKRAEWQKAMIESQEKIIERCQRTIDRFTSELAATNHMIDALKDEYRKAATQKDAE